MNNINDNDMSLLIDKISSSLLVHISQDGMPICMDGKNHNDLLNKSIFKDNSRFVRDDMVYNFKELSKIDKFITFCNLRSGDALNMLLIHVSRDLSATQQEILIKFYNYLESNNIDMSFIYVFVYGKNKENTVDVLEYNLKSLFEKDSNKINVKA